MLGHYKAPAGTGRVQADMLSDKAEKYACKVLKQWIIQQYMILPLSADRIAIWHRQYVMVQVILGDLNSPLCIICKE
eukprot:10745378-Ditylum_brightwellii.AAC.1